MKVKMNKPSGLTNFRRSLGEVRERIKRKISKRRKNASDLLGVQRGDVFWKARSRKEVFRWGVMGVTGVAGVLLLAIVANTAAGVPRVEATSTYEEMKTDPAGLERMAELNISYYAPCKMVSNGGGNNGNNNCGTPSGSEVVWIGDSYSTGNNGAANEEITKALSGVTVYSQGCKHISATTNASDNTGGCAERTSTVDEFGSDNVGGIEIAKKLESSGKLKDKYLVFALGTNDPDPQGSAINELKQLIAGDLKDVKGVVLVNARTNDGGSYTELNNKYKEIADANSNVAVADWAAVAKDEYFKSDESGAHPFDGYDVWVKAVTDALGSFGGTCTVGAGGCQELATLRQAMWNKASESDKKRFMHVVHVELGDIAGVEMYMNQVISKHGTNGELSDWLNKQCPAYMEGGHSTCDPEDTISEDDQKLIDTALGGSNNANFGIGNWTGGVTDPHGNYAGTHTCAWDQAAQKCDTSITRCEDTVSGKHECIGMEGEDAWKTEMEGKCGGSNSSSGSTTTSKNNDKKTLIGPSGDTVTDGGGGGKLSYESYNGMEYLQIIPENMEDNLPVIVYHVGSGEVGNVRAAEGLGMIAYVKEHASELYSKNGKFIFIAPSYGDSSYDSKPFVESVISKHKANSGKVIITGFSQGASTVYTQVQKYPDFYSAAAPADGCAGYFGTSDNSTLAKLKVSWYIMYGTEGEPANYETCNVSFAEELKANNGSVELVKLNSSSHSEAQSIFSTPELFAWMLGQGGNGNGNNCTSGGDVGKLQEVAKTYAWGKDEIPASLTEAKPAYQEATSKQEVPGVDDPTDCAKWTWFVLNKSGWYTGTKDWGDTGDYDSYLLSHGWTDVTSEITAKDKLLPGDVLITAEKGHAMIYVGEISGFTDSGFVTAGLRTWAAQADYDNYDKAMNGGYANVHVYRDTSKTICDVSNEDPCGGNGSNTNTGGSNYTGTAGGDVTALQNTIKSFVYKESEESKWMGTGVGTEAYTSALCELNSGYCGKYGDEGITDCGHFVFTTLYKAGWWTDADNGDNTYVAQQQPSTYVSWLNASPNWDEVTPRPSSESEWVPGDVIINSSHVWMYGGKIDGLDGNGFYQAAHYRDSMGESPHAMTLGWDGSVFDYTDYQVFRKKSGSGSTTTTTGDSATTTSVVDLSGRVVGEKTVIGPSGDTATDGGDSGGMDAEARLEYIWEASDKWMTEHNVNLGGGEKAAILAGFLGNALTESGSNPFNDNGSYVGIFMDMEPYRTEVISKVNAAVGKDYFSSADEPNAPVDAIKKAIDIEIDFEFSDDGGKDFFNNLDKPSAKTGVEGAKAYAELFAVTVERCVSGCAGAGDWASQGRAQPINDAGVSAFQAEYYKNSLPDCVGVPYQDLEKRRTFAEEYYNKFKGKATSSGSSSGTTTTCCGGSGSGDGGASGASVAKLQETAKRLIWKVSERDAHPGPEDARPEYRTAWEKWRATGEGGGGGVSDCGGYVFTIIRESGWDPDFKQDCNGVTDYGPGIGASCLGNYMEKSSEWEEVHPASASDWQPGDVYQFGPQGGDHIGIYVGDLGSDYGGDGFTEASYTEHTPWMMDGQGAYSAGYKVYRKKNVDIGGDGSGATLGSLTYYHQCDEPWGSEKLGWTRSDGSEATNCTSACGPVSVAMLMHMYDSSITPVETIRAGKDTGTYGHGSSTDLAMKVAEELGFEVKSLSANENQINAALDDGWTISFMYLGDKTSYGGIGHALGIYQKTSDGKWLIADPGGINPQNNKEVDKKMSIRRSNHPFSPSDVINHTGETLGFTDGEGQVDPFNGGSGTMEAVYAIRKK